MAILICSVEAAFVDAFWKSPVKRGTVNCKVKHGLWSETAGVMFYLCDLCQVLQSPVPISSAVDVSNKNNCLTGLLQGLNEQNINI